jgi:hypothetical protein
MPYSICASRSANDPEGVRAALKRLTAAQTP